MDGQNSAEGIVSRYIRRRPEHIVQDRRLEFQCSQQTHANRLRCRLPLRQAADGIRERSEMEGFKTCVKVGEKARSKTHAVCESVHESVRKYC